MNTLPSLLAAGVDAELIKLVVVLVIAALAWLAKLVAARQQAQPPVDGPRPQQPPRPAVNDPLAKDVVGEIDEFLRRAAQQRPAQPAQPIRAQPVKPPARPAQPPVVAEVVAAAPVGGKVTEHVQKYLDTEDFTRRGAQMGGEVAAQVDREIDQRLHQVFDHSVSQLATVPGESAAAPVAFEPLELSEASAIEIPATFATGLTDLLTSPESVRQAIVLNEILHRPEERW
jgi:hypothetical protein